MDLRRQQRFPVHFHAVLTGPKLSQSVGTIVNLSESGCCVESDSQVYTGMHVAMRLHVFDEESPIYIEQAAVRWSRERKLGVGFIIVAPPQLERLKQFLVRLEQGKES
ncbi:MAG TPA: PilZ domain-containing protein [Nitrospira sp.]